jgi:hypothetical protein
MGEQAVTERDVRAVAGVRDDVLRNLLITQAYHELSTDFALRFGDTNANWCTFATWASRSVGDTMRLEFVPAFIDLTIGRMPAFGRVRIALEERLRARRLRLVRSTTTDHRVQRLLHHVCHELGEGNRLVFVQIGVFWSRFVATFDAGPHEAKLRSFLSAVVDDDGHPLTHLQQAFRIYHDALPETDPKRRAERVLAANCLIGAWEQYRLQAAITSAIDTPVVQLIDDAVGDRLREVLPEGPIRRVLERGLTGIEHWVEEAWRDLCTEELMVCELPDGDVGLGRDLRPAPGQGLFPPALERITLPDVGEIWARYSRAQADCDDTAADDWLDFAQRMNFIVNLFRSRQQDPAMFRPPFSDGQIQVLKAGSVPTAGDL